MDFGKFHFGTIKIDGVTYEYDVVIDRGKIPKRKKKPSKKFREKFGHTPVSVEEEVPWKCRRLVIGTGRYRSLHVMDEVKREARRRKIDLLILPTDEAMGTLAQKSDDRDQPRHDRSSIPRLAGGRVVLRAPDRPPAWGSAPAPGPYGVDHSSHPPPLRPRRRTFSNDVHMLHRFGAIYDMTASNQTESPRSVSVRLYRLMQAIDDPHLRSIWAQFGRDLLKGSIKSQEEKEDFLDGG